MTLAGFTPSFIVLPVTLALSFIFWGLVFLFLKLSLKSMEGGKSLLIFGFGSCSCFLVGEGGV